MKNDQLVIYLDHSLTYAEEFDITIEYTTAPAATAISWVPANQTFGGDMKFMYTQCEAVHCRSVAPLQDGPGAKSTFNATLRVEAPYVAIASALPVGTIDVPSVDGSKPMKVYKYAQQIPVPAYLLALVAGHLEFKMAGLRAGVYAEPKILNQSAFELSEMDSFMNIVILYPNPD
jgi:leukotriene-A4 hydrolase